MRVNFLFPNKYKKLGWFLLIIGLFLGLLTFFIGDEPDFFDAYVIEFSSNRLLKGMNPFQIISNNIFNEIILVLIIVGGTLTAFSKEKIEDEYIASIRFSSLVWAVLVNYGILLITVLFVYNLSFYPVMIFNMFTILLFFIARFNLLLIKSRNLIDNEK